MYTRGLKHMANYRGKVTDSPLWKHSQMEHGGRMDVSYSMKVIKVFRDTLTRQVKEDAEYNTVQLQGYFTLVINSNFVNWVELG